MPQEDTYTLSVVDSSGRQVSILNHHGDAPSSLSPPQTYHIQSDEIMMDDDSATMNTTRRKYACNASGCFKSFTTSGHLARHHRIHTGEKNFPCLFPGCQSRFSRQDNMMQHYRTHMSPKSRRTSKKQHTHQQQQQQQHRQQQQPSPYDTSHPRLHAHHRIHSDVTAPLSIDQHLRNYHQSRLYHHHQRHVSTTSSRSSSSSSSSSPSSPILLPTTTTNGGGSGSSNNNNNNNNNNIIINSINGMDSSGTNNYSPSSSTHRRQSIRQNDTLLTQSDSHVNRKSYTENNNSTANMFYQHRPLNYTEGEDTHPTTLLNPTPIKKMIKNPPPSSSPSPSTTTTSSQQQQDKEKDVSSNSLIQLANIVSSFG